MTVHIITCQSTQVKSKTGQWLQLMTVHDSPWKFVTAHDSPWQLRTVQGSSWQSMAVHYLVIFVSDTWSCFVIHSFSDSPIFNICAFSGLGDLLIFFRWALQYENMNMNHLHNTINCDILRSIFLFDFVLSIVEGWFLYKTHYSRRRKKCIFFKYLCCQYPVHWLFYILKRFKIQLKTKESSDLKSSL